MKALLTSELEQDGYATGTVICPLDSEGLTLGNGILVGYLSGIPMCHQQDTVASFGRACSDDVRSLSRLAEVILPLEVLQSDLVAPRTKLIFDPFFCGLMPWTIRGTYPEGYLLLCIEVGGVGIERGCCEPLLLDGAIGAIGTLCLAGRPTAADESRGKTNGEEVDKVCRTHNLLAL